MQEELKPFLKIQDLDMEMLRLMGLKRERQAELNSIHSVKEGLMKQVSIKEYFIFDLKKDIKLAELEVNEIKDKLKKLEIQQGAIKRVEEFNALSHEMSQAERERVAKELRLSDLFDKLTTEEEVLVQLKESFESAVEDSRLLESEIFENIDRINIEGRGIKIERDRLAQGVNVEILKVYDRLMKNKKDAVIVPIENRCCAGCHIMITAQDENLVRKGERLVFCEHCSRIHYWPESDAHIEHEGAVQLKRRRKKAVPVA